MKTLCFLLLVLTGCTGSDYRACAYACKEGGLQMAECSSNSSGTRCVCGDHIKDEK